MDELKVFTNICHKVATQNKQFGMQRKTKAKHNRLCRKTEVRLDSPEGTVGKIQMEGVRNRNQKKKRENFTSSTKFPLKKKTKLNNSKLLKI